MTRPGQRTVVLGSVLAAAVVELMPGRPAVLVALAGLWLVLGAPAWLCRRIATRIVSTREAQWLLGLGFAVLAAMAAALIVNTVLPWFGVSRPLTTGSLAVAQTLTAGALAFLDRRLTGASPPVRGPRWMPVRDVAPVAVLGVLALVVAVAGAIRLNNGFTGATSLVALFLIAALLGLLAVRARRYGDGVIAFGILCAATALLLLTSLRGWYITGHDIQREFLLFQLTSAKGYWDISGYPDAYNACLSITLLPASLAQLTALPGAAIFKAVLPMLFAAAPVAVYRTTRNLTGKRISLLAAICFLAFPTFFTDMPFLGRQEIAFLLLGCAVLALSDRTAPRRARRIAFTVLLAGIVLSHYSTTYVLIGVLVLGKLASGVVRVVPPLRRRLAERAPKESADFVVWPMIGIAVLCSALWTGPVTGTWQQLRHTAAATARDLFHPDQVQRGSSDTAYSIFSSARVSPQQRLRDYADSTRARAGGEPPMALHAAAAQVAPADALPLTAAGSALNQLGVDVPRVNGLLRTLCADGLQVLLLVGLAGTLIATATVFRPTHDLFVLAAGGLGVLAAEIALPQLSVDYGLLRTFQQGLFGFAPFIAMGSVWALSWLRQWRMPAATAVSLLLFLDLTGALPRLFGGYPAQLQLDNAGQYYDIYYAHPQERAALAWLEQHTAAHRIQSDRYTLSRLQTLIDGRPGDDIYPTLVQPGSFVLLGYPAVRKDEVTVFYQGDLVTYRYPLRFLDATKNKVYSSNGTSVYR
ncbi:DUF2206 domain-containing protein [Amycolatopsis sp. FU40]|uniref:DUF2206 domain-containing protein n=1 Tax=Amycolatopsis sp. FU40 TaxID=2914159 RepID=UPI001F332D57|nr:DUF2206 domain-containing protein [Amycolatopsis sp. FU40]UKD57195.1 DUF2206 domain-containing protein [Amycolatopsis sp. FU40]